jgi:hypothetical protein
MLALFAMLAGCSSPDAPDPPAVPANVVIVTGAPTSAAVGSTITTPLEVQVVDSKGRGVPNVEVRWSVSAGGSVTSPAVLTDANGHARASWVLGTAAGPQTARATVTTATGPVTADFGVSATAGPATTVKLTPDSIVLTVGETRQLAGKATDAYGNEVQAAGVQWTSSDSAVAKVSATGVVTLVSEGHATISLTSSGVTASSVVRTFQTYPVAKFVFGAAHSCLLTTGGQTYCWGQNDRGQLGTGTVSASEYPVSVTGGRSYKDVSAHEQTTCAVATDGAAYCWGEGDAGQLGVGYKARLVVPTPVSGGLRFTSVGVGQYHACALSTAGKVYCWGNNYGGQLGIGGGIDGSDTPVEVQAPGLTFTAVTVGNRFNCALDSTGAAFCWGDNFYGQLGSGYPPEIKYVPTRVSGSLHFSSISAGEFHACGVAATAAYCWGWDIYGQVGSGNDPPERVPEPAPVALGLSFATVTAGYHMSCGLTTDGRAFCWGDGDLGVDGPQTAYAPAAVSGGLVFSSIYTGGGGTCAITAAAVGYCWDRTPKRFGRLLP